MNPGIRTSLAAVLYEIVGIHTVIPVDSTEGVAPELAVCFLALPGRNRGRGKRRAPFESDGITVSIPNVPGQIVSPANLYRVRIGIAVGDGDAVAFCFRTFLRIGLIVATEDPQ